MSEIIDTVQLQEVDDSLVDLYELEVRGETIYLYGGLDGGASVQFSDGSQLNEYFEFPIELEGIDMSSDGAASRPTLRIANVISLIGLMNNDASEIGNEAAYLGIVKNEDLIGAKITRRRTLGKYLGQAGSPVEFPKQIFILDRISSENNVVVEFELASPFDVEGVKLPARVVIGKYCPWKYQGASDSPPCGGCTWPKDSRGLYLDINDDPITGHTVYNNGTTYFAQDKVSYNDNIYRCVRDNVGNQPDKSPAYWVRIDLCGKTISSCKARFQNTNTNAPLPFGGFPGSRKFK